MNRGRLIWKAEVPAVREVRLHRSHTDDPSHHSPNNTRKARSGMSSLFSFCFFIPPNLSELPNRITARVSLYLCSETPASRHLLQFLFQSPSPYFYFWFSFVMRVIYSSYFNHQLIFHIFHISFLVLFCHESDLQVPRLSWLHSAHQHLLQGVSEIFTYLYLYIFKRLFTKDM